MNSPREPIIGYATPLVLHPGERAELRVSTSAQSYAASAVRLTGVRPDGGVEIEDLRELDVPRALDGRRHELPMGASVTVGPSQVFALLRSFSAACWLQQTYATPAQQVVLGTLDEHLAAGFRIVVDRERGLGLQVALRTRELAEVFTEQPLRCGAWTHVTATLDAEGGDATISASPRGETTASGSRHGWAPASGNGLLAIAAPQVERSAPGASGNGCFNGKISRPLVLDEVLAADAIAELVATGALPAGLAPVCAVDLAEAVTAAQFADRSLHRHFVSVANLPTVGVTGPAWTGRTSSFLQAPGEYDAVHFHDDDLDDAGWAVAFELEVPASTEPGVLAARLETADCIDLVPIFVTAPGAPARSQIVVLLPTFTYLAYANEHEILSNPPSYVDFTGRDPSEAPLGWRDRYAIDEGLLSLYDVHRDGSSVVYASARRPLANLRPDYSWPLLGGPHGLAVDLALLGFLRRSGFESDILTDDDLHAHGAAAIEPYRVLVTGGHPEYWSADMLDALGTYLAGGGRVMYLGGNGLYWVTGVDPQRPHVIEVRRGQAGSRPSSSLPGEAWLSTTHEEGGLWRHRGRPPNRFVGVGFTAMGGGPGRPYRRTPESRRPELAFAFEGVQGDEIGTCGAILGSAAAYEFDRADTSLGTPEEAVVIATASGFEDLYYPTIEQFMAARPELGDPSSELVRADAVLVPRENGGAVFAAGSAAWCGSLETPDGPTDIGIVTTNVLRRFVETARGAAPLARS